MSAARVRTTAWNAGGWVGYRIGFGDEVVGGG
jgi:hypothetical protein